jgi:hypothetical protein
MEGAPRAMKKGIQIQKVLINKDHITAYDNNGISVKLTRAQRQLFSNYKHWNFEDKICDEFGNNDVLAHDFIVIKDGEIVYPNDN